MPGCRAERRNLRLENTHSVWQAFGPWSKAFEPRVSLSVLGAMCMVPTALCKKIEIGYMYPVPGQTIGTKGLGPHSPHGKGLFAQQQVLGSMNRFRAIPYPMQIPNRFQTQPFACEFGTKPVYLRLREHLSEEKLARFSRRHLSTR